MNYATADELIAAVPAQLVADLTGTDEPDTDAIDNALADASAEMDPFLANRYALPLPSRPPALRRIAIDIALYRMQNLRSLGDVEDSRKRYEDAIKQMNQIAEGKISLGLPSDGSEGSNAPIATGIEFVSPPSILSGWGY